jgi:hypothetical protein
MARQPGPAKQLACLAALLHVNRDDRHSAKHAVQAGVPGSAMQDLGQSRRGRDDTAIPPSGRLEMAPSRRVAAGKLDETFGIEDQSAAYSPE